MSSGKPWAATLANSRPKASSRPSGHERKHSTGGHGKNKPKTGGNPAHQQHTQHAPVNGFNRDRVVQTLNGKFQQIESQAAVYKAGSAHQWVKGGRRSTNGTNGGKQVKVNVLEELGKK